jgi:hypothetical protein
MLKELNQKNSLGSGGKVALTFTKLLSFIWHGSNDTTNTKLFKRAIGQKHPEFQSAD